MTTITDDSLLEQLRDVRQRDNAFRALLKKYGDKLYWHIRRIVVVKEDAEDAMQETAIKVYRSIDSFKGDSSLSTWMYRIATNEALQIIRRRKDELELVSEDALGNSLAESLLAETDLDHKAAEVLFQQAVLQLPTQQQAAFNLRYFEELPYEQIAEITGKNVGTLKTNYHFAVEKIKNYIKEHTI